MNEAQYKEFKEELLSKGFFHTSNAELATRLYEEVKPIRRTLYLHTDGSFCHLKVATLKDVNFLSEKRAMWMQQVEAVDEILSHLMPSRSEDNQMITLTEGTEWDRHGDCFFVKSFLEGCDTGALTDDDGYAQGLLLHGKLVYDGTFEPGLRDEYRHELLKLAGHQPQLMVLWFNK